MDQIVHICSRADWQAAQANGVYQAASLDTEGFIHCSRPEQVIAVANRYYTGSTDLILLWIDPTKLTAELRWEPSEGDIYPHQFGALNLDAIIRISDFPPDTDGYFHSLPES